MKLLIFRISQKFSNVAIVLLGTRQFQGWIVTSTEEYWILLLTATIFDVSKSFIHHTNTLSDGNSLLNCFNVAYIHFFNTEKFPQQMILQQKKFFHTGIKYWSFFTSNLYEVEGHLFASTVISYHFYHCAYLSLMSSLIIAAAFLFWKQCTVYRSRIFWIVANLV